VPLPKPEILKYAFFVSPFVAVADVMKRSGIRYSIALYSHPFGYDPYIPHFHEFLVYNSVFEGVAYVKHYFFPTLTNSKDDA
jgi:hypothetical protein